MWFHSFCSLVTYILPLRLFSLCRTESPALHPPRLASGLLRIGGFRKVIQLFPQSPVGKKWSQALVGRPDQWQGIGIADICAVGACNCLTSSSSLCRLCPALCHFPASLAGGTRGRSGDLFVFPWALAPGSMQDCGSPTAPALTGLWKHCSTAYPFISRD